MILSIQDAKRVEKLIGYDAEYDQNSTCVHDIKWKK